MNTLWGLADTYPPTQRAVLCILQQARLSFCILLSLCVERRGRLLICAWSIALCALAQPPAVIPYLPQHRDHEKTRVLRKPLDTDSSISSSAFPSSRTFLHSISPFVFAKSPSFAKSGGSKKKTKSQPIIYACVYILKLIKMGKMLCKGKQT